MSLPATNHNKYNLNRILSCCNHHNAKLKIQFGDNISCPFGFHNTSHMDTHPSAKLCVDHDGKYVEGICRVHCFVCDKTMEIHQLISHVLNTDMTERALKVLLRKRHTEFEDDLKTLFGDYYIEPNTQKRKQASVPLEIEELFEPQDDSVEIRKKDICNVTSRYTKVDEDNVSMYALNRGISLETQINCGLMFNSRSVSALYQNLHGETLGTVERSISNTCKGPKTRLGGGTKKTGLYFPLGKTLSDDTIYVCEGLFDALSFVEKGMNGVATFGCPTEAQIEELLSYKNCFLCFDNDLAGYQFTGNVLASIIDGTCNLDTNMRLVQPPKVLSYPDPWEFERTTRKIKIKDPNDMLMNSANFNDLRFVSSFAFYFGHFTPGYNTVIDCDASLFYKFNSIYRKAVNDQTKETKDTTFKLTKSSIAHELNVDASVLNKEYLERLPSAENIQFTYGFDYLQKKVPAKYSQLSLLVAPSGFGKTKLALSIFASNIFSSGVSLNFISLDQSKTASEEDLIEICEGLYKSKNPFTGEDINPLAKVNISDENTLCDPNGMLRYIATQCMEAIKDGKLPVFAIDNFENITYNESYGYMDKKTKYEKEERFIRQLHIILKKYSAICIILMQLTKDGHPSGIGKTFEGYTYKGTQNAFSTADAVICIHPITLGSGGAYYPSKEYCCLRVTKTRYASTEALPTNDDNGKNGHQLFLRDNFGFHPCLHPIEAERHDESISYFKMVNKELPFDAYEDIEAEDTRYVINNEGKLVRLFGCDDSEDEPVSNNDYKGEDEMVKKVAPKGYPKIDNVSSNFKITNNTKDVCSFAAVFRELELKNKDKLREHLKLNGWYGCCIRKPMGDISEDYIEGLSPLSPTFVPKLNTIIDYNSHKNPIKKGDKIIFENETDAIDELEISKKYFFVFYDVETTTDECFVGVKMKGKKFFTCSPFDFVDLITKLSTALEQKGIDTPIVCVAFNDSYDGNMIYYVNELKIHTCGEARRLSDEVISSTATFNPNVRELKYKKYDFKYNPLSKLKISNVLFYDLRTESYPAGSLKYHCLKHGFEWTESVCSDLRVYNKEDVENTRKLFFTEKSTLDYFEALMYLFRAVDGNKKSCMSLGTKLLVWLYIKNILGSQFFNRSITKVRVNEYTKQVMKMYDVEMLVDSRNKLEVKKEQVTDPYILNIINDGLPYIKFADDIIISAGKGGLHFTRPGVYHENVWLVDFASFYPNILLGENNPALSSEGKRTYQKMVAARLEGKKNNSPEKALKVPINAVYGNLNSPKLGGTVGLTEAVTIEGQCIIVGLMRFIQKYVECFIDVNTDGIAFVAKDSSKIEELCNEASKKFAIDLEPTKVATYLSCKKNNYFLITESGEVKAKGSWVKGVQIYNHEIGDCKVGYNVMNVPDILEAHFTNSPLPLPKIIERKMLSAEDKHFKIVNEIPFLLLKLTGCSPTSSSASVDYEADGMSSEELAKFVVSTKISQCLDVESDDLPF